MLGHSQCGPRDLLHNIADMLVSELQRRGRFRTAYTGATRDLLKLFGWGIRGAPSVGCGEDGAISSPPAPYHLPLEEAGFEPSVPERTTLDN